MSELFYRTVRFVGRQVFRVASASTVRYAERASRPGAYLLASNHTSPYDAALIIASTPRVIYWLSIVELFQNPLSRWFLTAFGASPLDRSKVDTRTVRTVVRHLRVGRVVGIFPEGGLRTGADSVLAEGSIHEGICKLAQITGVPVLPCVVLGGEQFSRWTSWLPGARTRWTVAFGEPVMTSRTESSAALAGKITQALRLLHQEVAAHV